MYLPEKKEREYRFKLALRIGLPIFGLILVLVSTTLINNYHNLTPSFYIESLILILVSVYFIFYLIYKGFAVKITDPVSKTFSREYLYEYLKKEIKKYKNYTLVLVSIDNIVDINTNYGIKNGDKVLKQTALWLEEYFENQGMENFPIGRLQSGNFLVGFRGDIFENKVMIELLGIKSEEFKVENIEINISTAMIDTSLTNNLDHLIDMLYEQKEYNRYKKENNFESIDPNELEGLVIDAIENFSVSFALQDIYDKEQNKAFSELFVRLKAKNGKFIHQKKYLKVINKLQLNIDFDMMVLKKICVVFEKLGTQKIVLHVNTSSLRDPLFFNKVKMLLEQYPQVKNKIVFLFSENEYYSKTQKFNDLLHGYKNIGILSAVDRVGALHSSFLYLRDLDIDMIRYDSSYTKEEKFSQCEVAIKGLDLIAKKRSIKSWIKMIETKEQLDEAKEIGVDYFQGKYLSQLKETNL